MHDFFKQKVVTPGRAPGPKAVETEPEASPTVAQESVALSFHWLSMEAGLQSPVAC